MHQSRKQQLKIYLRNLIHAIKSQDEDYIDNITTKDVNINDNYFDDGTPLHVAARIGNYQIFQKLIKIGADIHNRHPITQETVLDSALKSSNYDIIRYLKENGVEKSNRIKRETALQFAVEEGTKEVMMLLLTYNADINATSVDKIFPISNAVNAKNYDKMDALMIYVLDLFCICNGDDDIKTIFFVAVDTKNYAVLIYWLDSFSDRLGITSHNMSYFLFFYLQMFVHDIFSSERPDKDDCSILLEKNYVFNAQDFIKRHIVELITAGLYVSKQNIRAVSNTNIFDDYSAECLLEVEKMKRNVIEGSNITFIEILQKNVRYLAHYLKIIDLNKILIREPRFPEYPIYENKIFFKLWKVQIRVNYIKYSEEVIYNIFYELQLPYTFIRELYFYLSNDDLKEIGQPVDRKKNG